METVKVGVIGAGFMGQAHRPTRRPTFATPRLSLAAQESARTGRVVEL